MKAIVYTQYGSPDVLQFQDVEKPVPGDDDVLVKVCAASANPADWHMMRAQPFLARLAGGLLKPKNQILGADVAGRVEAVGRNVTQFQPGDEVFGDIFGNGSGGSFAEYVAVHASALVLKPANLSFEQAAAIPLVGFTALQGLRDKGKLQAGQRVLINGASGGIGTFAVQYARAVGAEVTGVCSTRNVELVRSLGAAHVVDYTREDFTRTGQQYDLIFDTVGNRSALAYRRALRPGGRCTVAGFTSMAHMIFQLSLLGPILGGIGNKQVGSMGTARSNPEDLRVIKELLESGKVVPVIDRCYPLRETAEAIRYLEAGHARGKVVISVTSDN